jgi:hypothetical protein
MKCAPVRRGHRAAGNQTLSGCQDLNPVNPYSENGRRMRRIPELARRSAFLSKKPTRSALNRPPTNGRPISATGNGHRGRFRPLSHKQAKR